MTIELTRVPNADDDGPVDALVSLQVIGALEKRDYDVFAARLQEMVQEHGKLRLLVELVDFQGWTAGAVWEDVKLAFKHYDDIERLAIVGESRWEKGMAVLAKPFTAAKVRYFSVENRAEAERWIRESRK